MVFLLLLSVAVPAPQWHITTNFTFNYSFLLRFSHHLITFSPGTRMALGERKVFVQKDDFTSRRRAERAILRAGLTLMRRLQHKVDLHKNEHTLNQKGYRDQAVERTLTRRWEKIANGGVVKPWVLSNHKVCCSAVPRGLQLCEFNLPAQVCGGDYGGSKGCGNSNLIVTISLTSRCLFERAIGQGSWCRFTEK